VTNAVSIAVGQALARSVFKQRGNHSEVHLSELELAALLAIACDYVLERILEAEARGGRPPATPAKPTRE
jgi:threonine/homoserine efflux transporter RhtA